MESQTSFIGVTACVLLEVNIEKYAVFIGIEDFFQLLFNDHEGLWISHLQFCPRCRSQSCPCGLGACLEQHGGFEVGICEGKLYRGN